MVTFDVKITGKDMFDYNMYHNYRHFQGIISFILGVVMLVISVLSYRAGAQLSYVLITGFLGLWFTIITPVRIWVKSYQQVALTPSFKKPITYTLSEKEMVIAQDGVEGVLQLEQVIKAVDTGKSIVLYVSNVRAYIFPKRELSDKLLEVTDILKRSKIKKIKL